MSEPQDVKTTFKQNITCIFLSIRLKLLLSVHYETPCMLKLYIITEMDFNVKSSIGVRSEFLPPQIEKELKCFYLVKQKLTDVISDLFWLFDFMDFCKDIIIIFYATFLNRKWEETINDFIETVKFLKKHSFLTSWQHWSLIYMTSQIIYFSQTKRIHLKSGSIVRAC